MKNKVIQQLKENNGGYASGQALSESLGVSRTMVWKYINELKKEGYEIQASSKKGYSLVPPSDILNAFEIGDKLNTEKIGKNIIYFNEIDSTNSYAKKIAFEGCEEGTVVVADAQTSGRGRLGRQWNSLAKKGIWMSIVLRPKITPEDIQIITLAASVAVVSALQDTFGIEAGIKWPNDIILEGKKVCGILTEMNSEIERVNYIVLGIGINVKQEVEDLPVEIRNAATSLKIYFQGNPILYKDKLKDGVLNRSALIRKVLFELERIYSKINNGFTDEVLKEWKKYSLTLGKTVKVISKANEYIGIAEDITDDGRLLVRDTEGVIREVLSGEISVRGILGYV